MMNRKRFLNKAFTLAETLVVMGVIGVVAALTLPNLNNSTSDKEKVTRVKKVYSDIVEAVDRAQSTYGPFRNWCPDVTSSTLSACTEKVADRVLEFMKVSKVCGFTKGSGCVSSKPFLWLNGTAYENSYDSSCTVNGADCRYKALLSDGTSILFQARTSAVSGVLFHINVDIDGPNKGKTQEGSDLFGFTLCTGGFCRSGSKENVVTPDYFLDKHTGAFKVNGQYWTDWVIRNGNMDYLKCIDVLNWETKTTCK